MLGNDRAVEVVAEVAGVVLGREAAVEVVGDGNGTMEVVGVRALCLMRNQCTQGLVAHSQSVLEKESIDRSGHFGVDCFGKDIQGGLAKERTSGGDEDSGEGNLAPALYCQ